MKYFKNVVSVIVASVIMGSNVSAMEFDPNVDYCSKMIEVIKKGGDNALSEGREYELKRNMKIDWANEGDIYPHTNYFDGSMSLPEIRYEMGVSAYVYTDEDLDLLARLITAEAGCNWIPDWVQRAVGSVALNHLDSPRYPNTLRGVIYQRGVYGCVNNGMINRPANKRCIENARYILDNGVTIPHEVMGQGPLQGRVYAKYYDSILGTTMWFCY